MKCFKKREHLVPKTDKGGRWQNETKTSKILNTIKVPRHLGRRRGVRLDLPVRECCVQVCSARRACSKAGSASPSHADAHPCPPPLAAHAVSVLPCSPSVHLPRKATDWKPNSALIASACGLLSRHRTGHQSEAGFRRQATPATRRAFWQAAPAQRTQPGPVPPASRREGEGQRPCSFVARRHCHRA